MAMALSCNSALMTNLSSLSCAPISTASSQSSQWKPTYALFAGKAIEGTKIRAPLSLRVRPAAQKQKQENVETSDISNPPAPGSTTPSEATSDGEDTASSSGGDNLAVDAVTEAEFATQEKQMSPEEIGEQLRQLRIRRGEQSADPKDFWSGVWEETKLVEWPQFQKVLGTTGVVVGIIFGSSILLLTVNGLLAELSDQVFNGSSDFAKSWTQGHF